MRIGDNVKIKTCESIPELVGRSGEIADMQIQQYDKYRTYSIWVKMTSGTRKGRIYGFRENELEIFPPRACQKVIKQTEELLKGEVTAAEIAGIEKRFMEARGILPSETGKGFWQGKIPCWEMFRCPEVMRNECPAFRYRALPCWEIEGTYSKLYALRRKGR